MTDDDLNLEDWLAAEVPLWSDRSRNAVDMAISTGVPSEALAVFARWWQFESWLRLLLYLDLRAMDGTNWTQRVPKKSRDLAGRDTENSYMASVDATNPLVYLGAADLLEIIGSDTVWPKVKYALLKRTRWEGLVDELESIRNRSAHLRRPHVDDLMRLEQALRNLETGGRRSLEAFNRRWPVPPNPADALAEAWVAGGHADARRLLKHAERQYETTFGLTYSVRPWAQALSEGAVSHRPGIFIHASWYARGDAAIWPRAFWTDGLLDQGRVRDLIVLVTHGSDAEVCVTFSGADDPAKIADAIGACFEVALKARDRHPTARRRRRWRLDAVDLDWRVHTDDAIVLASDDQPFSLFEAAGK